MQFTKTCFILIISFLYIQNTRAQTSISFEESSYDKIILSAKKEQKLIFYMAYANWCPHYNKIKKEEFGDSLGITSDQTDIIYCTSN